MKNDLQEILLPKEKIQQRIECLGEEIDREYQSQEIVLITLLDGAIVFTRRSNPSSFDTFKIGLHTCFQLWKFNQP